MSTGPRLKFSSLSFTAKYVLLAGLAIAVGVVPGSAQAAPIAWQKDLRRAYREAATCRRPLLVMVGARWCGPCRKMHTETFPNPAVAARINSQFIPVLIDADEQPEAVKGLGVQSFPTVLVVSPEQRIVGRVAGFQSASQLSARLASYQPAQPFLAQSRSTLYRATRDLPIAYRKPGPYPDPPRPDPPRWDPPRPGLYESSDLGPVPAAVPETKPWAERTWDAIRARHSPTTLEAAVAFSTGR